MPILSFGPFFAPPTVRVSGVAPTNGSLTIDATDEKVAMVGCVPKTGNITKIGFNVRTVTVAGNLDFRLETVDATNGTPTGTLWGTNTNLSQNVSATGWNEATLTAPAAVTRAQEIAVVGNIVAAAQLQIWCHSGGFAQNYPRGLHYTTAWANAGNQPIFALGYDDGSYAVLGQSPPTTGNVNANSTFNTGSTPDERGLKFRFPLSVRVSGFWLASDLDGDADVVLYDSDGTTALQTRSLDKDIEAGAGNAGTHVATFPADVTLAANTYYRLVVKPTSVTNLTVYDWDYPNTTLMAADYFGADFHHTQRTDAGAWTDTTTKRAMMGLIVSGIDAGGLPLMALE